MTNDGTFDSQSSLFNPNDYDDSEGQAVYYVLNYDLFDNITLENTGKYIINEQSHTIYYYEGIEIDDTLYYTLPLEYKDTEYNSKHPIASISVSTVYLPMGGTTLDLEDYMTFTASDGLEAVPKSITYSVSTAGYSSYFSIDDGKITSASGVSATTAAFKIAVEATSYGSDTTVSTTLTVYLTDIAILDSDGDSEIDELNILKGENKTVYVQKSGKAGTLSLVAKVVEGNGIDATISNSANSSSLYPLRIQGTNEGQVKLTVLEGNGKAAKELIINVYEPTVDNEEIEIDSLDETEEINLLLWDDYDDEDSDYVITWLSSDEDVATVETDEDNSLTAVITSIGEGECTIYCEISIDDEVLATLEVQVVVTNEVDEEDSENTVTDDTDDDLQE